MYYHFVVSSKTCFDFYQEASIASKASAKATEGGKVAKKTPKAIWSHLRRFASFCTTLYFPNLSVFSCQIAIRAVPPSCVGPARLECMYYHFVVSSETSSRKQDSKEDLDGSFCRW